MDDEIGKKKSSFKRKAHTEVGAADTTVAGDMPIALTKAADNKGEHIGAATQSGADSLQN